MYKAEISFLLSLGIKLNQPSTVSDVHKFEEHYSIELPKEIREFYLTLNGYTNEVDMVELYSLGAVSKACESEFILPEIDSIKDWFILGDFGFQASFWLLEILGENYRLYVLNLGVINLVEISLPFKTFFLKLLEDPYTVIGMA